MIMSALDEYYLDNLSVDSSLVAWLAHVAADNGTLWLKRDLVIVAIPYDTLVAHCDLYNLLDWDDARAKGGLYIHYAAGDVKRMIAIARKSKWRKIIYHRGLRGERKMKVMMLDGGAR